MYACVILQYENRAIRSFDESDLPQSSEQHEVSNTTLRELCCCEAHNNLRSDLVDHIFTVVSDDKDDESISIYLCFISSNFFSMLFVKKNYFNVLDVMFFLISMKISFINSYTRS